MKKLLSLMMLMLLCTSAWAAPVTDVLTRDVTGVTGTSYTEWTWKSELSGAVYAGLSAGGNESIQLRTDKNNSGIVTTTSGGYVKKIVLTFEGNTGTSRYVCIYGKNSAYSSPAELYNDDTKGTLLGEIARSTDPITLTVNGDYQYIGLRSKTGALYLSEIKITWEKVATPVITFDPANPYEGDNVTCTITCATEGATIQYSTDDENYTDYPTNGFTLTENTTVYAKATLGEDVSEVASKTITFAPAPTTVASIAAFNALDDNTNFTFTGTVTAIAQKGDFLYVQDNEKGMLIYGSTGQTYAFGDIIPADFTGTKTTYNGAPEMINPSNFAESTQNVPPTAIEMAIADVNLANFGRYGVIRGATIDGNNIVVGENTVAKSNTFAQVPDEGSVFDIYGVVGSVNNGAPRFLPIEYVDKTPFALTITPANYTGTKPVEVTIEAYHAAEGDVAITYTLDGSDPSLSGALTYNNVPITITESCTLKAYAIDAQRNEATAEGTYVIVVPATKFKLVTNLSELEAGKQVLIAGVKESTTNGKTMYVMGAQNNNNRAAVKYGSIEEAPRNLNLTDGTVTGYFPMVLGKGDYYTFFDVDNNGYLYAASSSSNILKVQQTLNDNGKAAITLEQDGTCSVVFQGDNENKYMQFNSSSTLFSCYGPSNEQAPVYIYVEGEVVEEPIAISVSPEPGEYTEPQTIAFTVTGVPEGETATITYTIGDGEQQTYTEPFKLYKSATITVMAVCGKKSDIKEYTYTINLPALAFKMTPAPGEYDTAQEVTIACTNAIEGCALDVDWSYVVEGEAPIEGDETNMTFTAAKTGVLTIIATEANTDRTYESPEGGFVYTITEPATTYTITLDKEPGDYTALVNVKATVEPALPEGATLTFKINDAEPKEYNTEKGVNMLESGTLTFTATDAAGNVLATTSAEYKYIMGVFGDLNNDGVVDVTEVGIIVNLILGKLNNN